jgi:hypothetical protein
MSVVADYLSTIGLPNATNGKPDLELLQKVTAMLTHALSCTITDITFSLIARATLRMARRWLSPQSMCFRANL